VKSNLDYQIINLLKIEIRVSENFRRLDKVEKIHLQAPKKTDKMGRN